VATGEGFWGVCYFCLGFFLPGRHAKRRQSRARARYRALPITFNSTFLEWAATISDRFAAPPRPAPLRPTPPRPAPRRPAVWHCSHPPTPMKMSPWTQWRRAGAPLTKIRTRRSHIRSRRVGSSAQSPLDSEGLVIISAQKYRSLFWDISEIHWRTVRYVYLLFHSISTSAVLITNRIFRSFKFRASCKIDCLSHSLAIDDLKPAKSFFSSFNFPWYKKSAKIGSWAA